MTSPVEAASHQVVVDTAAIWNRGQSVQPTMVSFWPWKVSATPIVRCQFSQKSNSSQTDDSSPASFEKALSTLSNKITKSTEDLDSLRQRSRRFGLLWTLYSTFAYLLYSMILVLVVGWKNWGPVEYAAVAGGPPVYLHPRILPRFPLISSTAYTPSGYCCSHTAAIVRRRFSHDLTSLKSSEIALLRN